MTPYNVGSYRPLFAAIVALTMAGVGRPAQATAAADSGSPGSAGTERVLEEIVVSARKRSESAQDVPVAITAISAAMIDRLDLTSMERIANSTPDLVVARGGNGAGAQIALRGISGSPTSIGVEQSVAVNIDGAYYGYGRVINEALFDTSQIEILKGPQALFFGKNATAGVLSVTTADPTEKFAAKARLGYEFEGKQILGEGFISGPIGPNLTARLAVRITDDHGSYFRNGGFAVTNTTLDAAPLLATGAFVFNPHLAPALDKDLPGSKDRAVRATLKWTPTDDLTAILKLSYNKATDNADAYNYVPWRCAGGFTQPNPAIPCKAEFTSYINYFPNDIAGHILYGQADGAPFNKWQSGTATATISYKASLFTLNSVTNYQGNNNNWGCECQNESTPASFIAATEDSTWHAFSEEARLQTTLDWPVNFMVGVYYQKSSRDHNQAANFGGVEDSSQPIDKRYLAYNKLSDTYGKTTAAFGQVSWKITPQLEFDAGLRYTRETKDSSLNQPYINVLLQGVFPQDRPITANQVFNNTSPEATLTFKPADGIMLYGAYKKGYKSGGFSNSALISTATIPSDVAFKPETVSGFEFGAKTTFLDHRLRLNAVLFDYKYKDLQVDYYNSITFQFITTNAGSLTTKGVELDAEFVPLAVEGLTLHGSAIYDKARYGSYTAPCYGGQSIADGCTTTFQSGLGQVLDGKAPADAPEFTASLGGAYERQISSQLFLGFSADARYSDSYLASNFAAPLSSQDSYVVLDATARLRSADEHWDVALQARNLTNKFYATGVQDTPNTGSGTGTNAARPADQLALPGLPRTVRVVFTYRF
jgi:outer membrane receptor protein involved in Fe transport